MSSEVTVYFYHPARENCLSVNNIVKSLDPPYCHVEILFPNGLACSILMDSSVRLIRRSFDHRFYTGIKIQTSHEKVQSALQIAQQLTDAKVDFGFIDRGTAPHTYCSKLMLDILRRSEIMPAHFCAAYRIILTPSALYRNLIKQPHVVEFDTKPAQSTVAFDILDVHQNLAEKQKLLNSSRCFTI